MSELQIIPDRYRVLSGSMLKLLALFAMIVDHTAHALLSSEGPVLFRVYKWGITPYYLMRAFGRIAFPIYAFLLVEGFIHTRDRRKYGLRLALFTLISEVPWDLLHFGRPFELSSQSVFVTLLLAYLGLCVLERLQSASSRSELCRWAVRLLALFFVATVAKSDYGVRGFAMTLVLYLLQMQLVVQAVVCSAYVGNPCYAVLGFVPIALYNGERGFIRGRFLQLLFYAAYPAHMLLLYAIRMRTGQG
ncbi:MAG: TraX family protein [Atopobiaceae bacterium]|nr:TraX family protein [Atopobiaceae bacterium]